MPFPNKPTQFKKGISGNVSGRPKGAKNLATRLFEQIEENYPNFNVPRSFVKVYCKDKRGITRRDILLCVIAFDISE